jgi:transcriptional regulator with XRE-family HTH domain
VAPTRGAFAANLREARRQARLSQADLEHISGVPKTRLSRYENGHMLPSIGTLGKLARALEVSEARLLGVRTTPEDEFFRVLSHRGRTLRSVAEAIRWAHLLSDALNRERREAGRRARRRA